MKVDFVISGGVSLGTYEAGVMTAILQGIEEHKLNVELISGASAGAITSFICGLMLKYSFNPFLLYNLWVNSADISYLFYKNTKSLLHFDYMKREINSILYNICVCAYEFNSSMCVKQRSPHFCKYKKCKNKKSININAIIEQTLLEGYVTDIKRCFVNKTLRAIVYNDYYVIDFRKFDKENSDYYTDIVLSSAAMPFVFNSENIIKNRKDFKYKLSDNYTFDNYTFNYTDGGMSDNLPFSSLFAVNKSIKNIVMIMPHPKSVDKLIEKTEKNKGFKSIKNPLRELFNAYAAMTYQSLYSDYKLLCSINRRINTLKRCEDEFFDGVSKLSDDERKKFNKLMCKILNDREWERSFNIMLKKISNVEDKDYVKLNIITPKNPEEELSGEILNHFGGFLDIRCRKNDFILGYRDGIEFLKKYNIKITQLFDFQLNNKITSIKQLRKKRYIMALLLKIFPVSFNYYKSRFPYNILYIITRMIFELYCLIFNIKQYN